MDAALDIDSITDLPRHSMQRLVRGLRSNGKARKQIIQKNSALSRKGLLTEIFRKEAETRTNRKPI